MYGGIWKLYTVITYFLQIYNYFKIKCLLKTCGVFFFPFMDNFTKKKNDFPSGTLAIPSPLVTWCLNYYEPQKNVLSLLKAATLLEKSPKMNEYLLGCAYNLKLFLPMLSTKCNHHPKLEVHFIGSYGNRLIESLHCKP